MPGQQSNTDQQMALRNRWSSRTSSRIASGSWSRCHRHSSRPAITPSRSRNVGTHGLDRVGSCTELVRGHVCDGRGLARSVRGKPRRPSQISGRAHCLPTRRASLHHLDFATHPRPSMLYRLARSRVVGASRLEAIEDVLRTGCRPQGQEPVVRICEGSATADCGEARIANPGEDHMRAPLVASDQPNLIDAPDDELQVVTLGEGVEHGVVERGAVYRFEAPATPRLAYA